MWYCTGQGRWSPVHTGKACEPWLRNNKIWFHVHWISPSSLLLVFLSLSLLSSTCFLPPQHLLLLLWFFVSRHTSTQREEQTSSSFGTLTWLAKINTTDKNKVTKLLTGYFLPSSMFMTTVMWTDVLPSCGLKTNYTHFLSTTNQFFLKLKVILLEEFWGWQCTDY